MLGGIERKMIEVDQQAGKISGGGTSVFKRGHHEAASRLVNDLDDPGGGMRKLSQRGKLIPAVLGEFKISI